MLLQFLICEVNTELLKTAQHEKLKVSCNILPTHKGGWYDMSSVVHFMHGLYQLYYVYQLLPIVLKTFKTIDVKDPNQRLWVIILSNWNINFVHQPA